MSIDDFERQKAVRKALREKYGCPVWTTKNGDLVPVVLMGERHLMNAWRMMDRKRVELKEAWDFYSHPAFAPRGEIACMILDDYFLDGGYSTEMQAITYWLDAFEAEMQRRGLEVPARSKPRPLPKATKVEDFEIDGRAVGEIWRLEPPDEQEGDDDELHD